MPTHNILMKIIFVAGVIVCTTLAIAQSPPHAPTKIRFTNNNRQTLVQTVTAPGHQITIATNTVPGNFNNAGGLLIAHQAAPLAEPTGDESAITNNNDTVIVQQSSTPTSGNQLNNGHKKPQPLMQEKKEEPLIQEPKKPFLFFNLNTVLQPAKIAAGFLTIGYCAMAAKLWYLIRRIDNQNAWANWHNAIPLATLEENPAITAQKLFYEMKTRFLKDNNFLIPLVKFMQETEEEIDSLRTFLDYCNWLYEKGLAILLPSQTQNIALAHEKLERLEYLRNLTLRYAGEYKVETKYGFRRLW